MTFMSRVVLRDYKHSMYFRILMPLGVAADMIPRDR